MIIGPDGPCYVFVEHVVFLGKTPCTKETLFDFC